MWGGDCRKFLNDELGGGTVMGLLWVALLVGITGLAVDNINGLPIRTMLQATADADAWRVCSPEVAVGGRHSISLLLIAIEPIEGS